MNKVIIYGVELEINELTSTCDVDVWPKKGDEYWYLLSQGAVHVEHWCGLNDDFARKVRGNCHRTRQAAINTDNLDKATTKVLNRLRELENGEPIDWDDFDQDKYLPYYSHWEQRVLINYYAFHQYKPTKFYSTDRQAWVQVIKEMPKEVELIVRGE